jgi:REP element-mobilizing transposase RayT
MTAPRPILANRVYLITRRCSRREFLLRPDAQTNQLFLYCLAEAARRFNIGIIGVCAMSNHYHAIVYDPDAMLPRFLEHFHGVTARAVNRRRDRQEHFWSSAQPNVNYLVEEGDILEKTVYALANPVAAQLVDKAFNWPGISSLAWLDGRTITIKRPSVYFSNQGTMPDTIRLRLIAPPGISASAWANRVRERVVEEEQAAALERRASGSRVLGRKNVLSTSPYGRPTTAHRRSTLRPFIAAKNRALRTRELNALKEFRTQYRRAWIAFRDGARSTRFPAGTFALFHRCGVRVAPSPQRSDLQ